MTDDYTYREAERTAARIQRLSDDCWHTLAASGQAMDDDAWVGPVARRFHDILRAGERELQAQLAKAVRDAKAKLESMPRKS